MCSIVLRVICAALYFNQISAILHFRIDYCFHWVQKDGGGGSGSGSGSSSDGRGHGGSGNSGDGSSGGGGSCGRSGWLTQPSAGHRFRRGLSLLVSVLAITESLGFF